MKMKDLITPNAVTCSASTNLAAAAALMLDGDCGVLPVVDEHGTLTGIVTDRDLDIALATRNRRASDVTIGEVARTQVFTCSPDDDVEAALATMKERRVRRLVVEGFGGTVAGIVRKRIRSDEVVATLQAICAHHHPTPHVTAA